MRITNNMMTYNFLSSLNKSMEIQTNLQNQLADGIAVHKPSDDPVKATRVVRYNTSSAENGQFTQNLQDAQSWMSSTDGAMSDLSSAMIKLKTLVTSADSTKASGDINVIGKQVDEMINQIVQIGNTKEGDRYIFAGQNDSTAPFVRTTIQDPNSGKTKDVIVYNGDNSKISMPIQPGAVNPGQDSVNLTGVDVFGSAVNTSSTTYGRQTVDVLNHLIDIKEEMEKTSTVSQTNSAGGSATVGGNYNGTGYQNFDVRIDNTATVLGVKQVSAASYSIDNGNTWTAVAAPSILTQGDPTVITNLGNSGVNFSIGASANNVGHNAAGGSTGDVYSFRVPQTAFSLNPSNPASGATTVTGTYTGVGATPYAVRVSSVDVGGQINGADYSIDGGTTWSALSNYSIAQSNFSGGKADVTATSTYTANDVYQMQVTQVDSSGKIVAANYSINGVAQGAANIAYKVNSDSSTSATINMGGEIMNVATSQSNLAGDTYTANVTPTVIDTSVPGTTALSLPNGIKLNIAAAAGNGINDTFKFQFPQGNGPDVKWISTVAAQYVEDDHSLQLKAQTGLGVRMSMYDMAANLMQNENLTIQTDLSQNQDIDEAKAITDFNTAQNVYKSALAVGSKIMTKSLVDFLS